MKKEELTAAQRIMLAKGQNIYEPKPISLSWKTKLILVVIMELALLTVFMDLVINKVIIEQKSYVLTFVVFYYLIRGANILKQIWKEYSAVKLKNVTM